MSSSPDLRIGTKSIRNRADLDDYVYHFNANDKAEYTAYYSKDAVVSACSQVCPVTLLTLLPLVQIQWFPRQDH
jgi:hypothetical protein